MARLRAERPILATHPLPRSPPCYGRVMDQTVTDVRADTSASVAAPERLHALDAVRGGALLLGIVYHATLSFIPSTARIWIAEDINRSYALAVVFFASHVFRMTTFFLVAGFFAHLSF